MIDLLSSAQEKGSNEMIRRSWWLNNICCSPLEKEHNKVSCFFLLGVQQVNILVLMKIVLSFKHHYGEVEK